MKRLQLVQHDRIQETISGFDQRELLDHQGKGSSEETVE